MITSNRNAPGAPDIGATGIVNEVDYPHVDLPNSSKSSFKNRNLYDHASI